MGLIRAARDGDGCTGVVIVGAAGVGKTRLARAAVAGAGALGAGLEWAQATRSAATIPLAAFAGLLPPGARGADPLGLFQASTEAILARANGRPVVLGLDDAHLLDPASAALALHLALTRSAFVVATVRAGEPCPDAIVALWKDAGARRIDLGELPEEETNRLTEALLGAPVERVAAHWAFAASAGNPLYLRELLAGARESAALAQEEGLWRLHRRPPPGPALSGLVAQRLEGLDDGGRELLALLALGEPLELGLVFHVAGAAAVAAVQGRALMIVERQADVEVARLAHPLYGEVVLPELPGARAIALRVRLAEAVRTRGIVAGDALRVAGWLRDAGAPIEPELLVQAAGEAYRGRDPGLAAQLSAQAAADGGGAGATLALGQAQAALGDYAEAEQTLAPLEGALPSPDAAAGYLFARVSVLVWGLGRGDEAEHLVSRARGWWPDQQWRRRVEGMRLLVLSSTGRSLAAGRLADRLAADPELAPFLVPMVASGGAIGWLFAGETVKAQAMAERALPPPPADEMLGDRALGGLVAWSLVRLESGRDWGELDARVSRIERAAVERRDRVTAGPAAGLLGSLALARGAPVTAARLLREGAAHLQHHDPRGLGVIVAAELAQAEAMAGRLEPARRAEAGALLRLGSRSPAWHERTKLTRAAAWIAAAEGERARAAELCRAGAEAQSEWPVFEAQLLHQALSLGGQAGRIAVALQAAAQRCDAPLAAAYAAHATALAGHDAGGLECAARTLADIGAALAGAEAAAQAAALHAEAGRTSAAGRARALSARLQAVCEGVRTPALAATDPDAAELTPREREIGELAARGRSNAEIAAQLNISVRTVESHLYHAMTKLGIARREELPGRRTAEPTSSGSR